MIDGVHPELETLSISEAREAVLSGAVSAISLANQHYDRIAAVDPEINSYLALARDRAEAQAAKIDAAAKAGNPQGPLAGVPIGIKDVLVLRGAPATAGSLILKGYHPPYDATVVAKLEAAGAVLLGKLNCDEFAMGSSNENSAYGPVHNPRALDRVPGGVVWWVGGGSCCWALCRFAGDGYWWFYSAAGGVLWGCGCFAYLWASFALWVDCFCFFIGQNWAFYAVCGGCGYYAGGFGWT